MKESTELKVLSGFGIFAVLFVMMLIEGPAGELLAMLLGGLLAGVVVYRRFGDATAAMADASGYSETDQEPSVPESDAEPEPDPADDGPTDLDASPSEPPSPTDAETAVSEIAPGMAADKALDSSQSAAAGPAPSEESTPETEDEDATADVASGSKPNDEATADTLEESLSTALASDEEAERIEAVETVAADVDAGELDPETAVDWLADLLDEVAGSEVRVVAIEALGTVGTDRAIAVLEEHRLDTDTAVSKAAAGTLRNLDR